jgi:hypothetical protein
MKKITNHKTLHPAIIFVRSRVVGRLSINRNNRKLIQFIIQTEKNIFTLFTDTNFTHKFMMDKRKVFQMPGLGRKNKINEIL